MIHAQGDAPVTDARAKEIQDEIRTVLDHMRFVDPTKTAERLSKNAAAALEMNAAYDAYKAKKLEDALAGFRKALVAFDNYARAWFLLGLTYAEKKDWKESANALTRAAELDSQYAGKMGEIAWQQALEDWHAKPPRFEDANKLMKGVLAIDSKNIPAPKRDDYKKMVADWWADTKKDDAKKKDLNKNVRDLVSKCFRGDPEINKTLADVYCDAGETLLGADKKNHNTAHQLAGLADELDKASKRPDELKKKCKDAEKSLVPHK
ncbi:tetratricopeptide repeat protein [bacterium]|nr:tetratricopeptide repeat protein [bacterium]